MNFLEVFYLWMYNIEKKEMQMQEILSLYRRFTYILGIISRESRVEQATHSSEMIQVLELVPEKEIPFKSVLQTALLLIDLLCFKISPPIFLWQVPVQNFAPKTHLGFIGAYRKPVTSSTTFKKSGFSDFQNPDFYGFWIETISCWTYSFNQN